LADVVVEAERRGFVGPAPVEAAIEHARGFARGLPEPPRRLLDLGSGAGLPGLVLAEEWPTSAVTLLDANRRRCAFLRSAVTSLGRGDQVEIVEARAETAGRREDLRGRYDAVTARGFGRPAVTAECAAPFLRVGGTLLVSEPPGDSSSGAERWPTPGLAQLGLEPAEAWTTAFHYRTLRQVRPCPERFPRRVGVPAKRPLF
jgi:16S rRNA (guanine527-N7)-methyltransferase